MKHLEDIRDWCHYCEHATIGLLCKANASGWLPCDKFKRKKEKDVSRHERQ